MNQRIAHLAEEALAKQRVLNDYETLYAAAKAAAPEARLTVLRKGFPALLEAEITENNLLVGKHLKRQFWDYEDHKGSYHNIGEIFKDYMNKVLMTGGNHRSADFESIIRFGLEGCLKRIAASKEKYSQDAEKMEFLADMEFVCGAIRAWTDSYAEACRKKACLAASEERKAELLRMAEICERVPYYPAGSFREAIQSYWFAFILFPDGLGRIDQYLYPYYQADLDKGAITEEFALELIEELFINIFQWLGKDQDWSANNHGVIAGYTREGECGHNRCTSLVLKAVTELPTWRPQISYRVTSKTTMEQLREAVEANYRRPDLVMFLNDDVIVENMCRIGVTREDAVGYSVSGCNETVLTGCSQMGSIDGHVNLMWGMDRAFGDMEALKGIDSFEAFYGYVMRCVGQDLRLMVDHARVYDSATAANKDTIASIFTADCIESATPVSRGGARYNHCTYILNGVVNMADSLSVVKQMVFEEKRFTLTELAQYLKANWEGYEDVRSYIVNNAHYFGNDDDYADTLVNRVTKSVCEMTEADVPYRGGRFIFGTLAGYELAHVVFGKATGASPDGRRAGDPFSASIAPFPDADKTGMTAYLKSAAKIDGRYLASSVVVNFALDRAAADTEEKRARLTALLNAYFRLGGVQLQINYLSADELKKAQQTPEKYKNLRVRVTGFSGFFTLLDKDVQDEVVSRALHDH